MIIESDGSKSFEIIRGDCSQNVAFTPSRAYHEGADHAHLCHTEGCHSGECACKMFLGGRGGCCIKESAFFWGAGDEWQEIDDMVTCLHCVPSPQVE